MRTKTLVCAAALAAGLATTSMAQNVYSLNIVGYVNTGNTVATGFPAGNSIHHNPLDHVTSGVISNTADQVFGTSMPDGTIVNFWNGSAFITRVYDTSLGIDPSNWYLSDGTTGTTPPNMPVGEAFFLNAPSPFTNTFVGQTTPLPNASTTNSLPAGNSLIGSRLPIAGSITNAAFNFPLVDGTIVSKWTGSAYDLYVFDSSLGIDPGNWYESDGTTGRQPPSVALTEGFFMNAPSPVLWTQSLTNAP